MTLPPQAKRGNFVDCRHEKASTLGMRNIAIAYAIVAIFGFIFSTQSTYDFISRTDRLNPLDKPLFCGVVPGQSIMDTKGSSGCHTAMMSPYSSVMRSQIWGGIPLTLFAMGTFGFLVCFATWIVFRKEYGWGRFLLAGTMIPVIASLVMAWIAYTKLGTACTLCLGIYGVSACLLMLSLLFFVKEKKYLQLSPNDTIPDEASQQAVVDAASRSSKEVVLALLALLLFVMLPSIVYAMFQPKFEKYLGSCGTWDLPKDTELLSVPGFASSAAASATTDEMVEVFDPLCNSCRAFEERLSLLDVSAQLERKLLPFPLDNECNWMVGQSLHPGACLVSQALICADPERRASMMQTIFDKQEELLALGRDRPKLLQELKTMFPATTSCMDTPKTKAKLNQFLRTAVKARIPVSTPQAFVRGQKLCDADTDLGLDWALTQLIQRSPPTPGH